ncbi:adenylyl-sulfate kinase [Azospirillum sp. NL1]|uniref:adenylyl-sulfate kinase n=1 Tax=Azospirillum sp. NL1 TaxID=3082952 RepID=UPI00298869B2|nr:adenylyl-sulfate kinase [Azospirillum sp. NL1]MDW5537322.1 adenylyl-sulfate kinase [Azospirillum sp. NL1]
MPDGRGIGPADDGPLDGLPGGSPGSSPGSPQRGLLRFITCGSVDDGKSTLIGRLLYDSRQLFDDQITQLDGASRRFGTTGSGQLDLALLVDGLAAEREQGITIDVAYRFFSTSRRAFIAADTPGHVQYTRNMATAASTADVAVLLADARKGVLPQTRRHSLIAHLLGVRQIVLAVNKMDAVDWDPAVFEAIAAEYTDFAGRLGIGAVTCIPLSALTGDNVCSPSPAVGWYRGPSLLGFLETVESADGPAGPFRMPAQWVNRPHADFRGVAGTVAAGRVRPGDPVVVLPAGRAATVARIVTMDGDLDEAVAEQAVTLVLAEDVDVARGDQLAAAEAPVPVTDRLEARILCLDDGALLPHRSYLLQIGTAIVGARIAAFVHAIDVDTLEQRPAGELAANQIGLCRVVLDRPVACETYRESRDLGGFILIDRVSNATVGCGMVTATRWAASDLHPHPMVVDRAARAAANRQQPCVLWFTGLSGAGKSSVADRVEQELHRRGHRTMSLDGDALRHGLGRDLGFTDADRRENVRRVAEVARLMAEAGLIVLVSLIAPFRRDREAARLCIGEGDFIEIFVDAPLDICEGRDPKGLYRKARAGTLPGFTGIDSPYEAPVEPDLHLHADRETPEQLARRVVAHLDARGALAPFPQPISHLE